MKIQIVACGSSPWQLCRRYWGFAAVVDDTVLFDTFCSGKVLSRRLIKRNIDIAQFRQVVISHDHWDHTGGLDVVLSSSAPLTVYVPQTSSPTLQQKILQAGACLQSCKKTTAIDDAKLITPEMIGGTLEKPIGEIALAFKSGDGLCLVVGCAHPGIVEMVKDVQKATQKKVHTILGGLHLMNEKEPRIRECALALKKAGVGVVMPTHCTGKRAREVFKEVFGQGYQDVKEGSQIEI